MRVFLSVFSYFSLAIPNNYISSIMIFRQKNQEDNNIKYVSLPRLFNIPDENIKHGIILKNSNIILLTAKVECETDIRQENIYPPPKTLGNMQFSHFFSGILFNNTEKDLILLLNTQNLIKYIEKDLNYD